jgi:2',3'-cyclic-nucleotide 2'-phosphodiesterase (5'-nucleotidase family)
MDTKPVSCNFQAVGADESYYEPYSIVTYGDVKIAYIGITTPSTITTSSPTQFKDAAGNYIYTFNSTTLYDVVQKNIDAAEAEGADYIIALSHIGYADDEIYGDLVDVETLIENTDGFDIVLDAHSHTVIENMQLVDKGGNTVTLTSTGTKFEYVGKLTISDGEISTELVKVADYTATDPVIDAYIAKIYDEYATLAERKVADSLVELAAFDPDGNRLVRVSETNLGEIIADAVRYSVSADVGYLNGGGLRANIPAGEVSFADLLNVLPFNNTVVLAEIDGQTLKDMMEMAMRVWPEENGAFPHLSGMTFSVNTSISSSVVLDENGEFVGVDGEYRVYDIEIFDSLRIELFVVLVFTC